MDVLGEGSGVEARPYTEAVVYLQYINAWLDGSARVSVHDCFVCHTPGTLIKPSCALLQSLYPTDLLTLMKTGICQSTFVR